MKEGREEAAGWTQVILPTGGASASCGQAARTGNLQKLKQESWAGLLGGCIWLDLSVWRWFLLFSSVAWGYQAICDVFYWRLEGQDDRVFVAGNLVRTQISCRHWLSMHLVHLPRDSCSIRIISVQPYMLYLATLLNSAVWDSPCPPNILIAMKEDTWGRTQQLWTNRLVSIHLRYVSCLLEITFCGIPSSLQWYCE